MRADGLYSAALEIHILMAIIAKKTAYAMQQRLDTADAGISGLQYMIMRALRHHQQTISELSQRLMLDPSTLVPAVDALERKGFAKRGRDPNDRRRIPLSLTEHGAEFIAAIPALDDDNPLIQSLNVMGEEERLRLLTLLRELVRHMPEGEDILRTVASRVHSHTSREPALP